MTERRRTSRRTAAALLGALALLGCRTGADGDPWASLYSTDGEPESSTPTRATDDDGDDDTDEGERPVEEQDERDDSTSDATTEPDPDTQPDTQPVDPRCAEEKELCNGVDDNCNGLVDEAYSCPAEDNLPVGGVPFEGGLYFVGRASPDGINETAIQRFWPNVATDYVAGFGTYARDLRFRRSDWQLFYTDNQTLRGQVDGPLETPDCAASAISAFDFDAENTLYYLCDDVLRRGAGEVVAEGVRRMLGATDDGRVLAHVLPGGWGHYHDGEFHPADIQISGANAYPSATIQRDRAVVAVLRDAEVVGHELMLLQFDEQSHWSVLRRIQSEQTGSNWAGLTDGTSFISQLDPDTTGLRRFLAVLPDGSERPVWREADATDVFFGGGFLLGPRDPADILR